MVLTMKTDSIYPQIWMLCKDKMTKTIKICFVVETTFKMTSYLADVQASMDDIVDDLTFHNSDADVLVGAVYYRDHKDADDVTSTPFMSVNDFFSLPVDLTDESRVWWKNENDAANVAVGLHTVSRLDWSGADVKLIFHYGISPAHGSQFHGAEVSDLFPGGCPEGFDLLAIMHEFSLQSFDYTFYRITGAVDTMLEQFDQVYTGPGTFQVENLDIIDPYTSEPDSEEE